MPLKKKIKLIAIFFISFFVFTIVVASLIIYYYSLLFSTVDGRGDIKKYTPMWFVTMNRSTIGNMPILKSIDNVEYYYASSNTERWEVVYKSEAALKEIQVELQDYLIGKKAQLNARVSCYNGVWEFNDETVMLRSIAKDRCIIIYLDDKSSHVLVRALEME